MQHPGHGGVLQVGRAAAAAACWTRTCLLRAVPGTALVYQHPAGAAAMLAAP